MNCYHFEMHLSAFEDLVSQSQHLANLVFSDQLEHLCSCQLLDLQEKNFSPLLKVKWLQLGSNPEPLISLTNTQPFGQTVVWIHSETPTWHDKNIQSHVFCSIFFDFSTKPCLWLYGTLQGIIQKKSAFGSRGLPFPFVIFDIKRPFCQK